MITRIYAKRQMANLWGRSVGQLNQKIVDVELKLEREANPPTVEVGVLETSNTEEIPEDAEIWLNIRRRLRIHRYYCGTRINPLIPDDVEGGGNQITAFGEKFGEAKWEIKFVDPQERGRVWAWTEPFRLVPRKAVLRDDYGNALLSIGVDQNERLTSEAWGMDFEDANPAILVNPRVSDLMDMLKTKNEVSLLLMPEVLSHIIDRIIQDHCENSIEAGASSWQGRWLTWANNRVDSRLPPNAETSEEMIQCLEWKTEVIQKLKDIIEQAPKLRECIDGGDEQ